MLRISITICFLLILFVNPARADSLHEFSPRNFEISVKKLSMEKPVLAAFMADYCSACRRQMPILKKLAQEMGERAVIGTVNSPDVPQLVKDKHNVIAIPTMLLFYKGELLDSFKGLRQFDKLLAAVKQPYVAEANQLLWSELQVGDVVVYKKEGSLHRQAVLMKQGKELRLSKEDNMGRGGSRFSVKSFPNEILMVNKTDAKAIALEWQKKNPYPNGAIRLSTKRLVELADQHIEEFAIVVSYIKRPEYFGWNQKTQSSSAILHVIRQAKNKELQVGLMMMLKYGPDDVPIPPFVKKPPKKVIITMAGKEFKEHIHAIAIDSFIEAVGGYIENESMGWDETLSAILNLILKEKNQRRQAVMFSLVENFFQHKQEVEKKKMKIFIIPMPDFRQQGPPAIIEKKKGKGEISI